MFDGMLYKAEMCHMFPGLIKTNVRPFSTLNKSAAYTRDKLSSHNAQHTDWNWIQKYEASQITSAHHNLTQIHFHYCSSMTANRYLPNNYKASALYRCRHVSRYMIHLAQRSREQIHKTTEMRVTSCILCCKFQLPARKSICSEQRGLMITSAADSTTTRLDCWRERDRTMGTMWCTWKVMLRWRQYTVRGKLYSNIPRGDAQQLGGIV